MAFNRPGYDGSDAAPSDHLTVADDAVELADGLGLGRFAVLGMSIGGGYALACAARHPERVSAAAIVAARSRHDWRARTNARGNPIVAARSLNCCVPSD